MKNSKAVNVTVQDIKGKFDREYNLYTITNQKPKKDNLESSYERNKDFACQYESKNDTIICTCRRTKRRESRYFSSSRQVYRSLRYSSAKGFTDVGVGSVKTVTKKRVRRVYLPETKERGIGSSDLTPFFQRRITNCGHSYYDQKKTSSKCVGGVMEHQNIAVLSKQLSAIIQIKSGATSPQEDPFNKNIDINSVLKQSPVVEANVKKGTQSESVDNNDQFIKQTRESSKDKIKTEEIKNKSSTSSVNKVIIPIVRVTNEDKDFSSDSLVQYVHNLENPSSYKQSKISIELIENKLEREYRKFFSTKSKECKRSVEDTPISDFKSASLLRRRFAALRRGLSKKEESKKDCIVIKVSSQAIVPVKKDVSIASDPPSLEARSYSYSKICSPFPSPEHMYKDVTNAQSSYKKSVVGRKESSHWSTDVVDSDYQNVKGMFKLWGKKFNLEDDSYKKMVPIYGSNTLKDQKKKVELILPKEEVIEKEKKEGKRFSFFKKKKKDKSKQPYKSKKGVTAGRCEVGDGLMIKIGAANDFPASEPKKKFKKDTNEYEGILRKTWIKKFLANNTDSQNSVRIRWNNDMYATSSSTVFELMECVYKNTGIILRSKSEVTTGESSYYSHVNPRVNFMQKSIEAWMIPKMIKDNKTEQTITVNYPMIQNKKKIEVSFSNQKCFIEKSKAFSRKIELVLHSKNFSKNTESDSSEYIMIDIPKGYFSDVSTDNETESQTSDEKVFNIVEYETPNSTTYFKKRKMDTGDHELNNIRVTVSERHNKDIESTVLETVIKEPPLQRDVVVQGSNVYVPKRCDVIGVGIITQRDIRDIKKPILKIRDELSDDDFTPTLPPPKKCELAESYLQDYYRNWTPLGLDLFSWCVSDSQLRGSSDNYSLNSFNNQGDGSKSCPNIYDDYQASTIISSCATSSCSHCVMADDDKKNDDARKSVFFKKLKKKSIEKSEYDKAKRVLPKDSLEVFKRRKLYASSNKSNWGVNDDRSEPYSVPSIEDKGAQNNQFEYPNGIRPCCKVPEPKTKTRCKKRVALQDCGVLNQLLQEQLSGKIIEGILSFKGAAGCDTCKKKVPDCPKHALVIPAPICEIPQPPCIESCTNKRRPPCSKKNSPTCHVPHPPKCPVGEPSPCLPKLCPPSVPPCAMIPPCIRESLNTNSTSQSPIYCPNTTLTQTKSPTHRPKSASSHSVLPQACLTSAYSPEKANSPKIHSPRHSFQKSHTSCACPRKESPCSLPQCPNIKKSACVQKTPPCRSPCKLPSNDNLKKNSHQEFPWPIKNQTSKPPSPKYSETSLKRLPKERLIKTASNKCTTALKRLMKKFSNSSFKNKDCKPDCANRSRIITSPRSSPSSAKIIPINTRSQPKVTGVHLKKMPQDAKNSSKECKPCCNEGVIRLNSREKITINIKQQTPSTEEIREACNIKVQDEDGQTLYERRDYRADDRNRTRLVKDMYRESQIQRVSTQNTEVLKGSNSKYQESKSDTSLSNIVEINFNLKFKQGNKSTEVNLKNCGDTSTEIQNECLNPQHETPKEVYIVEDCEKRSLDNADRRDVNIKIVIKSYQQNCDKSKKLINCINSAANDEFTRKISEKFHTVSTGYSDVLEQQAFSVHTTTINLTDSFEKPKSTEKLALEGLVKEDSVNLTDCERIHNIAYECSATLLTSDNENGNNKKLLNNKSEINISGTNTRETNDEKSETIMSTTDNEDVLISDVQSSNMSIKLPKIRNKEEKKKMLKKIFESANDAKNVGNKGKMRSIRQKLRAVLTSDSSGYEDSAADNDLARELTYASLKPNYFKDSDSMTNYYQNMNSRLSLNAPNEGILYPTEENNSEYSDDSNDNENLGCLCSHLAEKLKIGQNNNIKACCCRRADKMDVDIQCDLITEDTTSLNKTACIDAETQDLKYSSHEQTLILTRASNTFKLQSEVINKKSSDTNTKLTKILYSQCSNNVEAYSMKKISRQTALAISDDDKVIVLDPNDANLKIGNRYRNTDKIKTVDILQLHETKKAVLEIYAEKTLSDNGERMVAKLPKFVYKRESELCNYEEIVTDFKRFNNRNIIMSVTR